MGNAEARIRFQSARAGQATLTVTGGLTSNGTGSTSEIPCLEWCIDEDCMNVADSATFRIANIDGENTGALFVLQLVVMELRDPDVAAGKWCQTFKGRVLRMVHQSDEKRGSTILVEMMDLGWHLTRCKATPFTSTESGTIDQLIRKIIDPSWGLSSSAITHGNVKNRNLRQGRLGVELQFIPELQKQLILIQVEIGQTPMQILQTYAARIGLLINVGVQGDIILFQPDYKQQQPYDVVHFHKSTEGERFRNNVCGAPTLDVSGEGLYTQVECYSTVVAPNITQQAQQQQNPNAQFLSSSYSPSTNPCPFTRIEHFMDPEAIGDQMRKNRAIWKSQTDQFNSWSYTVQLEGHSSGGAFYSSDTMIGVSDTVHQVEGSFYIQKVRRWQTLEAGTRTQLTLRLPWLLNPSLQAQTGGAGVVRTAQSKTVVLDQAASSATQSSQPKVVK
jgi:hypothetical protein